MIDLYKYISEGLLRGMDGTLASGESDADYLRIKEWLEYAICKGFVSADLDNCIDKDNKINALNFNPWYAGTDGALPLPAPDYIRFGLVSDISMTMTKNVDFTYLPHIDNCSELLLKPFVDDLKFDLARLPIDKVRVFEWVYDSSDIVKYPKNTVIDTFIMLQFREPYTSFGSKRFMIGFDKLKGLKCNTLAIPDIIFTENYTDFNTGYNSLIKKGSFEFDSQPGKELLKLYDDNAIQFKNLYVYSTSVSDYKFYKIKKEKNHFSIAKRGTTLI